MESEDTDHRANLNEQVSSNAFNVTNVVDQEHELIDIADSPTSPDRYISYQELAEKYSYLLDDF